MWTYVFFSFHAKFLKGKYQLKFTNSISFNVSLKQNITTNLNTVKIIIGIQRLLGILQGERLFKKTWCYLKVLVDYLQII